MRRQAGRWAAVLALPLAGCAASPPRTLAIPAVLLACPAGPPVPVPPARPRTIESISAWGNRDEIALRRSLAALAECDRRRAALVRMLPSR